MLPKRRSDVTVREVDGEILVLDGRSEKIHQLNTTAGYIWDRCDGATSLTDIVNAITTDFGTDKSVVEADVAEMVEQFRRLELLEVTKDDL